MNGTLTVLESAIWARAYERSLSSGDDHGWAANAGDNAVLRDRAARKQAGAGDGDRTHG